MRCPETKCEKRPLKKNRKLIDWPSQHGLARLVQRANVIQAMLKDPSLPAGLAGRLAGYECEAAGWRIVKRSNAQGLAGLEDKPGSGRPRTHPESERSDLIEPW
jgi:hypothetical protein